jgi:hypothetical protein
MPGPAIAVPAPVIPPQQVVVPGGVTPPQTQVITPPAGTQPTPADPFTDGAYVEEEELPLEAEVARARGVRPYGGGHPWDWYWGCGGSPYRTKGACDDWKVGPDWAISINGMVMSREDADLDAINAAIVPNGLTPLDDPTFENFDFGPGARITFMSQVPYYVGYQVQAAYEGIEAWESSIVYEKQPLPDIVVPLPPNPPYVDPFPEGFEQRRLHYRSNYHSGELNWLPGGKSVFKPLFGVRYINLDDEINDFNDQEAQPPLPGPGDLIDVDPGAAEELVFKPIGPVTTTDRLNLFDIQNNLIGFQIGLMYDTWKINRRLSLEGFVNSGVYYNKVKYNNTMGIFTTQVFADNTNTTDFDEARIDFSDAVNVDAREYDEISYTAEASLSGILRLNKCWALRGGYQVLWIGNVQLAEDAYLGNENETDNLIFHGWHFGIECRR